MEKGNLPISRLRNFVERAMIYTCDLQNKPLRASPAALASLACGLGMLVNIHKSQAMP